MKEHNTEKNVCTYEIWVVFKREDNLLRLCVIKMNFNKLLKQEIINGMNERNCE